MEFVHCLTVVAEDLVLVRFVVLVDFDQVETFNKSSDALVNSSLSQMNFSLLQFSLLEDRRIRLFKVGTKTIEERTWLRHLLILIYEFLLMTGLILDESISIWLESTVVNLILLHEDVLEIVLLVGFSEHPGSPSGGDFALQPEVCDVHSNLELFELRVHGCHNQWIHLRVLSGTNCHFEGRWVRWDLLLPGLFADNYVFDQFEEVSFEARGI